MRKVGQPIQNDQTRKWYERIWLIKHIAWLYMAILMSYYDIKNFIVFRKMMKNLVKDPNSKFSKLGLRNNWLGNIVYTEKMLDKDRMLYLSEPLKVQYIKEATVPEHSYLFDELGFGEYLVTEFIDFTDPQTGIVSGYYGVTFTFKPLAISNPRLYRELVFFILFFGLIGWIFRHQIWAAILWFIALL